MTVLFVLKGYPRLSETFIAQEILALQQRGLDLHIVSLRHPTDKARHPIHSEITAPLLYLPEYLHQEPIRVLKGLANAITKTGFASACRHLLKDLRRDFSRSRIRRFGQACVLSNELPATTKRLHFHFLHTPASVTRYTAQICGLPWSGSAHAKDIWTSPEWDLREKLAEMDWLVTCTGNGATYLQTLAPSPEKVSLVYHGLDLNRFDHTEKTASRHTGEKTQAPVKLLSVGRLVAKKGYDNLLEALGQLPQELNWQLTHIGGGELSQQLEHQAQVLGVAEHIAWLGARPQKEVLASLQQADLFVLASKISADGDRDGLPNVLMEAQSQTLCVLSTTVSAVPELIEHGVTGHLVPPDNSEALAKALEKLISEPEYRNGLALAGEQRVRTEFDMELSIGDLSVRFDE